MTLPVTLLKAIKKDGRFLLFDCYQDSDGYWLQIKPGFISGMETHCIHEHTVKECLEQIASVLSCDCILCMKAK